MAVGAVTEPPISNSPRPAKTSSLVPCKRPGSSASRKTAPWVERAALRRRRKRQHRNEARLIYLSETAQEVRVKVGVLGSGGVAQTLATGFLKHGHQVTLGSRTPDKLKDWAAGNPKGKTGTFAGA